MAVGREGDGAERVRVGKRNRENDAKAAKGVAAKEWALGAGGACAATVAGGVAAVRGRAVLGAASGTVARPK